LSKKSERDIRLKHLGDDGGKQDDNIECNIFP